MNKKLIPIGAFILFSILPVMHISAAENIHFIIDGSGSMWGRVDGKEKIVIAKKVILDLITNLPKNIQIGLTAYGHRSKSDCQDIEMLVKNGEGNREILRKKISGIIPKGMTPITGSIELVAKYIQHIKDKTNIVLVSDGKETCGKDPCKLVRRLIVLGYNFKIFVIGFDVTKEEKEELSCLAITGGGQYFDAQNSEELVAALATVKEKVVEKKIMAIELTPADVGSAKPNVFSVLPTKDPSIFGFKGRKIGKVNFDTTPDGTKLSSGTLIKDQYASEGVLMNEIIIRDSVYGGAASPPNATRSPSRKGFGQVFTFTVPVTAVGVINTSPDKDRLEVWSGPNGTGKLLFSFIDQTGVEKNYNMDRFIGVRVVKNDLIGSIVYRNNTGSIELDELIFEIINR